MQTKIAFVTPLFIALAIVTTATPLFAAGNAKVLHRFHTGTYGLGKDGFQPYASLISDAAGNLYGTTAYGGHSQCDYNTGCGTVFELAPSGNGQWTETILHDFTYEGGYYPLGSLVFDAAGNLYGTTSGGGNSDFGTVFELTSVANSTWTYGILYNFTNKSDGGYPYSGLIFDAAGNLYGTTAAGGDYGWGTVFQLAPGANGKWTEKVLHSFQKNDKDGNTPADSLAIDAAGNLYGMTCCGGAHGSDCDVYGCGVVFEIVPGANGEWIEKLLHTFNKTDGWNPAAPLILDAAGNLYGTTQWGGAFGTGCTQVGCGTVFELSPEPDGRWKEKVLHSFDGRNGSSPNGALIFDGAGHLYGTTESGGANHSDCGSYNCGVVFELKQNAHGRWTERVLQGFNGKDGANPSAGLILDSAGNLYGTTPYGGAQIGGCHSFGGCGTVFEVTP